MIRGSGNGQQNIVRQEVKLVSRDDACDWVNVAFAHCSVQCWCTGSDSLQLLVQCRREFVYNMCQRLCVSKVKDDVK